MSKRYLTVTPAYGRDYKSKAAVIDAWEVGLDFVVRDGILGGGYINNVQANDYYVMVRYSNLAKVVQVN